MKQTDTVPTFTKRIREYRIPVKQAIAKEYSILADLTLQVERLEHLDGLKRKEQQRDEE